MFIEPFLIFISTMISLNQANDTAPVKQETKTVKQATYEQPALMRGGWDGN